MNLHFLIDIVLGILIVGFLFWLISFLPVEEPFKKIAKGVVVFVGIIWLIQAILKIFNL